MTQASILFCSITHKRNANPATKFITKGFYLLLPLNKLSNLPLSRRKFAPLSFYEDDYGGANDSLESWARNELDAAGVQHQDDRVMLMCMPRIFGYVFNPINFWFFIDPRGQLSSVLCEVNNTFGESCTYVCTHSPDTDSKNFSQDTSLKSSIGAKGQAVHDKKMFVSPFLDCLGYYSFSFNLQDNRLGCFINHFSDDGGLKISTSVSGQLEILNKSNLRKAFWGLPLITFKVIFLIHWRALRLAVKGAQYFSHSKSKQ